MERILVVKLADIGDVLTATPALRALRERFRDAQLDLLTTPAAAQAVHRRLADRVLTAPRNLAAGPAALPAALTLLAGLRRAQYDAFFLFHHLTLWSGVAKYRLLAAATGAPIRAGLDNGKGRWLTHAVPDEGFGACHEIEYWLRVVAQFGATTRVPALHAPYEQGDLDRVGPIMDAFGPAPVVAIHPGSGGYSPARRWEPHKWAALADALVAREEAQILLVGTADDDADAVAAAMASPVANLAGKTDLTELAAILALCDLFVGADSGVMHVASSVGIPVVALFGPSNHLAWGPWRPGDLQLEAPATVARLGLGCSPCSYVGHRVGQRDGCWHRSCMADLTVEQVLAAVDEVHPFAGMHWPGKRQEPAS